MCFVLPPKTWDDRCLWKGYCWNHGKRPAQFCRITRREMIFPQMSRGLCALWMQISPQMLVPLRFVLPSSQQLLAWPASIHLTGSGLRWPVSNPQAGRNARREGGSRIRHICRSVYRCLPTTMLGVLSAGSQKKKKSRTDVSDWKLHQ